MAAPTVPVSGSSSSGTSAPPSGPSVTVFSPPDSHGPQVPVRFTVSDPTDATVDMRVRCSIAGGAFTDATPAATSDGMTGLAAPNMEADYRFIWDAATDLAAAGVASPTSAQLEFMPTQTGPTGAPGAPVTTRTFAVDTSPHHVPAALPPPAQARPLSFDVVSGDGQTGISGQWLPQRIQVQLHDDQAATISGVAVRFTAGGNLVTPSGPAVATIERDPAQPFVTDGTGIAGVRLRIPPDATGTGWVKATVVGSPSVASQQIGFTVVAPQIFHDLQAGATYEYGYNQSIDISFNDGANGKTYFEPDPVRPIRLKLEGTACRLSHSEMLIPQDSGNVQFVPTIFAGAGEIKVSDAVSGKVLATIPIAVKTTAAQRLARRWVPGMTTSKTTDDVNMRLAVVTSTGAAPQPCIGYPGLTLSGGFAVQVIEDGVPNTPWGEIVTNNRFVECSVPAATDTLQVSYTVFGPGAGSAGGLALKASDPPQANLPPVDTGKFVYFTPSGPGPWILAARVQGTLADPNAIPINYPDPNDPTKTICEIDHGLDVDLWYSFLIERPPVKLVAAPYGGVNDPALDHVAPGDQVQLVFGPVSPATVAASSTGTTSLDQVTIEGLKASGLSVGYIFGSAYTGLVVPFDRQQNMSLKPGGMVVSDPLLLTRGQPTVTGAVAGLNVVTGGLLHAANGGADIKLPVRGLSFGRVLFGDHEPVQESPTGSSLRGGAADTLLVHSGEFAYSVTDCEMITRGAPLAFSRTWRSANRVEGPLGPGWIFDQGQYLDVSGDYWMEWINARGMRSAIYPWRAPPRGYFISVEANSDITADNSAIQIMDAHRNVLHFHPDGTLRFAKDRCGNITRYEYNELGQLTWITDALNRIATLSYYKKGDPVHDRTIGKLKSIVDFNGSEVTYDYYGAGDPNGSPGWLKKVSPPKGTIVLNGALKSDYSRSETYWYQMASSDPLDGQLASIRDSEGQAWITNHYQPADRRISSQDMGAGSYSVAYDPAKSQTSVTDRATNLIDYHIAESAWWEAATADQVTQHANATARPGAADAVFTLRHNHDGLRLSITHPSGLVVEHVYDDTKPEPRSWGNLLAIRMRGAGRELIQSFEYEPQYNFVRASYPPRGNAPGENPWSYVTRYVYDYELSPTDDHGNLVRMTLPRTLNWAAKPGGAGGFFFDWMDENPTLVFTWNQYGLLTSLTDEAGVVTELAYYPVSDPTGQTAPTPAASEGGFLGQRTRDTTKTTDRTRHYGDMPPLPLTTKWRYSPQGDVLEEETPAGIITRTETNALHEVVKIVERSGRPDAVTLDLYTNEYGEHARTVLHQPAASADSGGPQLVEDYIFDRAASTVSASATNRNGVPVTHTMTVDGENNPVQATPPAASATPSFDPSYVPPTAATGSAVIDENGRPASISDAASSSAPLTTSYQIDPAQGTEQVGFPDGTKVNSTFSPFGDALQTVDPRGGVLNLVPDGGNAPSRVSMVQPPAAGGAEVSGFSETRIDEWGRAKRFYVARRQAGAAGGQAYGAVPDFFPQATTPWPPATTTTLGDGPFGRGDGRVMFDRQFDVLGAPSRFVNDELNTGWIRRDPHGRVYDWSDSLDQIPPYQNLGHAEYDVPNMSATFTLTEHATDPLATMTVQYAVKELYDSDGRVVSRIDGEGNATYFQYDETGHLFQTADAVGDKDPANLFNNVAVNKPGNVTTYWRDGLGRIRRIETLLTTDGAGGHLPDANHTYNSDSKLSRDFIYDDAGLFRGYQDHDQRLTEIRYDAKGRVEKILFNPCQASGSGPTVMSRTYDVQNRVDTATDANGTTLKYTYDAVGRLDTVKVQTPNVPGSQELHFEYDGDGNVRLAEDRTTTRRCEFVYDSQRLLRQATVNGALPLVCDYDGAGRRVSTTYPGGGQVVHTFDRSGRLRQVSDGGVSIASFEYLGRSRVAKRAVLGVTSTYTYSTGAGRLKGITVNGLMTPFSITYTIDRDPAGRIRNSTRNAAGPTLSRRWTYDSVGRIIGESETAPTSWPWSGSSMLRQYDGNNVLRQIDVAYAPVGSNTPVHRVRTAEERGRVLSDDAVTNNLILYDKNGNLTALGDRRYVYDAFNRLIRVDLMGATLASYEYDALHRMVKRTGPSGQVEEFVWDGWRLLEVRQAGLVTERYVYGTGLSDPLTVELNQQRHVILQSPEGSVDGLVDPGRNTQFYHYTLGGEMQLLKSDLSLDYLNTAKSRLQLHNGFWDPAAACYYFRRRWYSPAFEQFLTPDPMGFAQSSNQYGYCLGDPVNRRDPVGAFTIGSVTIDPVQDRPGAGGRAMMVASSFFKAAAGATWGVVDGFVLQPLATVVDAVHMGGEAAITFFEAGTGLNVPLHGRFRHSYLSGVGSAVDSGQLGYGEFLGSIWEGIKGTPSRIYDAASRGDAAEAGYEMMNAYLLLRGASEMPGAAKNLSMAVFRNGLSVLARRGWVSQARLIAVRQAQAEAIMSRMMRRMPRHIREQVAGTTIRYEPEVGGLNPETGRRDIIGRQGDGHITVWEGAFRPSLVDPPPPGTPRPGGFRMNLLKALKGASPENTILHELYHSYQQAAHPVFYETWVGSPYWTNPLEFTWPDAGFPVEGAHNFAWNYGPATAAREFALAGSKAAFFWSVHLRKR